MQQNKAASTVDKSGTTSNAEVNRQAETVVQNAISSMNYSADIYLRSVERKGGTVVNIEIYFPVPKESLETVSDQITVYEINKLKRQIQALCQSIQLEIDEKIRDLDPGRNSPVSAIYGHLCFGKITPKQLNAA